MLRNSLLSLGFPSACAPNRQTIGLLTDSSSDPMWDGAVWGAFPLTLDVGHDDYFATGRSNCPTSPRVRI